MNILNNLAEIKKLDSQNMLGSLEHLPRQIEQISKQAEKMTTPADYANFQNAVALGMGGSALGAHIIKCLFQNDLSIPFEIINGYNIPEYVNENTLVVASSYSGTTEETISALQQALEKKAKIAIISSGGALAEFAKKNNAPALIYTTENNPCGSPRMGLGYSIFGQIILFTKLGLLKLSASEIEQAIGVIDKYTADFGANNPDENNLAKQTANDIGDRSVWYIAAEHLSGNAHAAANQINENAKRFAGYFLIPELNHHLMEGMLNPKSNAEALAFILIESDLYDARVIKRFDVTKKVLEKNGIRHLSYQCVEKNKLSQACEALVFGSYVSYYLAILSGIDPTAIPFVDFFKEELKK